MRALIQHEVARQQLQQQQRQLVQTQTQTQTHSVPQVLLFFGCRKQQRDYLYHSEWESLHAGVNPYEYSSDALGTHQQQQQQQQQLVVASGSIEITTAFSQDQETKDYVTHRIKGDGRRVCDMLTDQVTC